MTTSQEVKEMFVGIDVSKDRLDVAVRPSGEHWSEPNGPIISDAFVQRLRALQPTLIVVEATGGLEAALVAALAQAKLPVAVVNPKRVRDFARASGQLAKTDSLDADVMAHFAEAIRPPVRLLPSAASERLAALATRRRQVLDILTSERNRQRTVSGELRERIAKHIAWLEAEVADLDKELRQSIDQNPAWQAIDELTAKPSPLGMTRQPRSE